MEVRWKWLALWMLWPVAAILNTNIRNQWRSWDLEIRALVSRRWSRWRYMIIVTVNITHRCQAYDVGDVNYWSISSVRCYFSLASHPVSSTAHLILWFSPLTLCCPSRSFKIHDEGSRSDRLKIRQTLNKINRFLCLKCTYLQTTRKIKTSRLALMT
jgi:hypothetical protein